MAASPDAVYAVVADVTACAAPGCWRFDAAAKRFEARVFAPQGQTRQVHVR